MTDGALDVRLRHRFGVTGFALDVAFAAPPGVTALFGPSGSGKTSVVNAVAGLIPDPTRGRISLGDTVLFDRAAGVDRPRHVRGTGYVFQGARLFPHLDVRRNLLFARRFARGPSPLGLDELVARLGIDHLLARQPATLSGGEAQRVAIGRALLGNPRVLLLDEPLAALDEARKEELLPVVAGLGREAGLPILYVSHSVSEVVRLAHQVVVMESGARAARRDRRGHPRRSVGAGRTRPPHGRRLAAGRRAGAARGRRPHGGRDGRWSALSRRDGGRARRRRLGADRGAGRHPSRASAQTGLSALNVLAATVTGFGDARGSEHVVGLAVGADRLLARVTARSARMLALAPGEACFAIVKVTGIEGEAVTATL